ncbi:unnamed protein product [Caenorhabditis auriculariae]|uniref:Uncharacterized protein n=1 Tax=Caenorhabditis auriculariae TaxID=2777116 RepID=A0A8S1HUT3_9PELO|nr:unnamed protein product [Caenorhabditis auriculariae]
MRSAPLYRRVFEICIMRRGTVAHKLSTIRSAPPVLIPGTGVFSRRRGSAKEDHLLDGFFPTGGIPTDACRTYGLARVSENSAKLSKTLRVSSMP